MIIMCQKREIANLCESPYGSAIIWKVKNLKEQDYEKIPLKEIAIAIKEKLNMKKFALDYNVKLKKNKL